MISRNKVAIDDRGDLYELVPGGTSNRFISSNKIGNIYASKATKRYVPRAGHYHKILFENFLPLSGTMLWYFEDFRETSRSFGKSFVFTFSESEDSPIPEIMNIKRDIDGVPLVAVPPGVYHLYFPLTDDPALVLAVASEPYDPSDYYAPIPDKTEILERYLTKRNQD